MSTGKKIAIVLPNLQGGGVERVRLLLAEQFLARGYAVDIVLMEHRGELLADVPPDARIVSLDAPRLRSAPWRLRDYFLADRPDAVLAAMWPLSGLTGLALRMARLPSRLVVSEHNDLRKVPAIKPVERLLLKLLGRWIYDRAARVVAVSHGVADSLRAVARVPADRIEVIYNPIRQSAGQIADGDRELLDWWHQAKVKLISVGSLKPQKDYPALLKALKLLRGTVDARLILLGEGPERASLERQIETEQLSGAVRLFGFRSSPQPYLAMADVFVLSSRWEGLGNVITEALFAGCKVVSTDCPSGPAELLADGKYGRLVPVGNAEKLAEAILETAMRPYDPTPGIEWASGFNAEAAAKSYLRLLFPETA